MAGWEGLGTKICSDCSLGSLEQLESRGGEVGGLVC